MPSSERQAWNLEDVELPNVAPVAPSNERQDWNLEDVKLPNVAPVAPSNEMQDWNLGVLLDASCAQQ